jgi:FlaA1/EpsC-like NDP-sugar epimerase
VGDVALVVVAWASAVLLRYDAQVPDAAWSRLIRFLPLVVFVTLACHAAAGLYTGVMKFASVLEARQILVAQGASVLMLLPASWLLDRPVPLSVPLIATVLCCGMAGAARFWSRLARWHQLQVGEVERLIVIGGGEAASSLLRSVGRSESLQVVAVVDDDDRVRGLRLHGVKIRGPIDTLGEIAEVTAASRAVLAISSPGPEMVHRVADLCAASGMGLSVIPTPSELLGRQVSLQDVRDLEIVDLLGRAQVETDLDEIVGLVSGRRILITGGGGSIGSELARQISSFGPQRLVLLDHDETHLFDALANLPSFVVPRLCDVRDRAALNVVFADERPEVVFHAAAHKHVPLLEDHPVQAVHTNVLGTQNVLQCAASVDTARFVFISTDKAVRPTSVMGSTKLTGEHLVAQAAALMTTCSVRFGNVLGSRGSVVPTFVRQIRAGGPVTITDGRMTRYFMSIPEAVRLVLHAAALSRGGEIFMLDMGEPVRIIDLAKRMIQLSGQRPGIDVEIRVTNVRPGEKLAEELHAPYERQHPTSHPSIVRLEPISLPREVLTDSLDSFSAAVTRQDGAAARSTLEQIVHCRAELIPAGSAPVQAKTYGEGHSWT